MSVFSPLDYAALAWFLILWIGYTTIADHTSCYRRSISAATSRHRRRWMRQMLGRDVRIVDTTILSNLNSGIGFFASTALLGIGGLVAMLGAAEQGVAALAGLPGAVATSHEQWEMKVLVLLLIFVYAFFKFGWAFRLSNYSSIMVGAAPPAPVEPSVAEAYARQAAKVHGLVAHHFNRGLRAYFFALAVLSWFVHPLLFMAATLVVVGVLYRREFRSRALNALSQRIGTDP